MKAIVYRRYGSPAVLELVEVPNPVPGPDEVLVKIHAASANMADAHMMRGKPLFMRLFLGLLKPKVDRLGIDLAGVVESAGAQAKEFKPGDEVFGVFSKKVSGAFAEYGCVSEALLARMPDGTGFEEAAAVPVAAMTALQGLRAGGEFQAGWRVLIHGAGGGVGMFAVQIAKAWGAEVTAVCGPDNVKTVRSLRADRVIDYTREDFAKEGLRYDLILAVNGYRCIFDYRRALNEKGRYVMVGGPMRQFLQALALGPFLSRLDDRKLSFMGMTEPNKEDLVLIRRMLDEGKIRPVIDRRYALDKVPEALRYLEKGHAKGKVVIVMSDASPEDVPPELSQPPMMLHC